MGTKLSISGVTASLCMMIWAQVCNAQQELCPRGEYTFILNNKGMNEIRAKVTLPTPGYAVTLYQSPQLIRPPRVYFVCKKPSTVTSEQLISTTSTLATPFSQVDIFDQKGSQRITAVSDGMMLHDTPILKMKTCFGDGGCGPDEFCDTTPKCPDGKVEGVCTTKPDFCPKNFLPVLACNGLTYPNHCAATADGQSLPGVTKRSYMGPQGEFPIVAGAKPNDPGDHWPFGCNATRGPGDAWPFTCRGAAGKKK